MKRVESVWAALSNQTSLSKSIKVDLSNAAEIQGLYSKVEGYIDSAASIRSEFESLVKDYDSIRSRINDLAEEARQVERDMFDTGLMLDGAEKEMIKKAGDLGVSESMVVDILADLNIYVESLLKESQGYSTDLNNIVGRSGSLPELR